MLTENDHTCTSPKNLPNPLEYSSFASYFPLKILAFENPSPLRVGMDIFSGTTHFSVAETPAAKATLYNSNFKSCATEAQGNHCRKVWTHVNRTIKCYTGMEDRRITILGNFDSYKVEPRYNEGLRHWQNVFAITRLRHIVVNVFAIDINKSKGYCSLYWGLHLYNRGSLRLRNRFAGASRKTSLTSAQFLRSA